VNELLQMVKAEADRWIEAGAGGWELWHACEIDRASRKCRLFITIM
jgi:hypothetical protein